MSALSTTDPAVAAAMARCLTARILEPIHRTTTRHPRWCGWCEYPIAELRDAVDEFNQWADFSARHRTGGRLVVRSFSELAPTEQERRVTEAQGFEDEPEAAPIIEEEVPWLPA